MGGTLRSFPPLELDFRGFNIRGGHNDLFIRGGGGGGQGLIFEN